jgi:deoxyribodipyrimidine photolyase-related protein
MYDRLAIILGNCLFEDHKELDDGKTLFFMKEDKSLCTHFNYHKHKIVLFLSAMRHHRDEIKKTNKVVYFEFDDKTYEERLSETLKEHGISKIITYDIEDKFFEERLINFSNKHGLKLDFVDSKSFLTTKNDFKEYLKTNKLFMQYFYIWQRKRLFILLEDNGKPVGGKWSFDQENRKSLQKNIEVPKLNLPKKTKYVLEVSKLVEQEFNSNPGSVENFYLPVTREDALMWLDDFFKNRFNYFGDYEDAISKNDNFLFHSVLSPLINLGLLTPKEIVRKALTQNVPINSKEGFIRQIIGWREFIRGCYNNVDYNKNFFNHTRLLSKKFYEAKTGIVPVDDVIKKVTKYGYSHHIERLMVLSNFMLLCEINPNDVYKWFMELYVDSSDWVMVPNVYGMGQFAEDSFATKPYISGSAYILKMSDYEKGDWQDVWDGLYWRFINKNRAFFKSNPRMAVMVSMFDKMNDVRKANILNSAERFLESL